MNTIEQPLAPRHGSRDRATERLRSRGDTVDVVLLLATILTLFGMAAGIAIAFPLALESASLHASLPSAEQALDRHAQPQEAGEEENEPFVTDDVRTEGLMRAAAAIPAQNQHRAPEDFTINR